MKQNLMQGEEMPLMNKIKTIYKTHDNGKIIPQNGGFGTMDNHCCVPLQEANLNEIVVGCETNPKLECVWRSLAKIGPCAIKLTIIITHTSRFHTGLGSRVDVMFRDCAITGHIPKKPHPETHKILPASCRFQSTEMTITIWSAILPWPWSTYSLAWKRDSGDVNSDRALLLSKRRPFRHLVVARTHWRAVLDQVHDYVLSKNPTPARDRQFNPAW
ncbi:MFS-type transporter SLC18B1 [Trichonephila clavipes]|nr:MFS-type transporter SLC18B1 [Trichonephila clavipes]